MVVSIWYEIYDMKISISHYLSIIHVYSNTLFFSIFDSTLATYNWKKHNELKFELS